LNKTKKPAATPAFLLVEFAGMVTAAWEASACGSQGFLTGAGTTQSPRPDQTHLPLDGAADLSNNCHSGARVKLANYDVQLHIGESRDCMREILWCANCTSEFALTRAPE
jgi:hypothetical protein